MKSLSPNRRLREEIKKKHFRVAIFGSARIQINDPLYILTYELSKEIGKRGFDIVTGGGPGIMDAGNKGHMDGSLDRTNNSQSIGLTVRLPHENSNMHLDIKGHFERFSERLDHFMLLSSAIVVMPGGVGTCLEFFYTWQLMQVNHICSMPVILIGDMWEEMMKWVRNWPLKHGYLNKEDLMNMFIVSNHTEALEIIDNAHKAFLQEGENYCFNFLKYKLQ